MTDFGDTRRTMCRNPKCRMKLPAPTDNPRDAFCCRGCFNSFYLRRCFVCEGEMVRKSGSQKICGKRKCRNALAAGPAHSRYLPPSSPILTQKAPDSIESKVALKGDRTPALGDLPIVVTETAPSRVKGWEWCRIPGTDGTRRVDNDWELFNRKGKMVARVHQEGDAYWLARPKMRPEPALESLAEAKVRGEHIALSTIDWPDSERHRCIPA